MSDKPKTFVGIGDGAREEAIEALNLALAATRTAAVITASDIE